MFIEPACRTTEALINRGIDRSVSAATLCEALQGRRLAVRVDPPGVEITLTAMGGRVHVAADREAADATITGTPLGLRRLLGPDPQAAIRDRVVEIRGDGEIAERFNALLRMARPDFEEELSHIVGDAAAHQLGNVARDFAGWAEKVAETFARSLSEYLREERRDLPTRTETEELLADVDALSNDVARAEARLTRLQQRLQPGTD